MITLTVVSHHGVVPTLAPSAGFDELGGCIGRAGHNQLVLPDPERVVSRVHARVVHRAGAYALANQGANPVLLNGRPVAGGHEAPLADGDEVQIGGYVLRARRSAPNRPGTVAGDPFADLMGRPVSEAPPAAPAPATGAGVAGGIPVDWDPFAPDPTPLRPRDPAFAPGPAHPGGTGAFGLDAGAAAPATLAGALVGGLAGHGRGGDDSLDALFGLRPGTGGDPLAHSRLDAPMAQPNMAASPDPRRSLRSAPLASAATVADDVADLERPYAPPLAFDAGVPATATLAPAILARAVLSWDAPGGQSRTVIEPPARLEAPVVPDAPEAPPPVAAATTATATIDADAVAADPLPALLAAFRAGLDAPGLALDPLTPELMHLVGRLLHEALRGTVDLLVARAEQKREARVEATLIVARENNPLKFSPNAEVALQHLLSPTLRGFMGPVPALRDAYNDLRAHQSGCVAGLHRALAGVLARLEPAALERQAAPPAGLRALLPAGRKAALWDAFVAHHARLTAEAGADPHGLVGPDFLRAYDARVERHGTEPA